MNYEMFKEKVAAGLETFLPDAHRDRKIDLATINGLNGPRDVMCFMVRSQDKQISPKVYLDELYEEYKEVQDLNAILYCTARDMCSALEEGREYRRIIAEDDLEENVTFQFVNTAKNEEYLKQLPHREYHDLSVIYRVLHKLESGNVYVWKNIKLQTLLTRQAGHLKYQFPYLPLTNLLYCNQFLLIQIFHLYTLLL